MHPSYCDLLKKLGVGGRGGSWHVNLETNIVILPKSHSGSQYSCRRRNVGVFIHVTTKFVACTFLL